MPRITLVGYRGTGKSTVAGLLATRLGCGWQDADTALEDRVGCSIATLIRTRGEPAFRDQESTLLAELLAGCDGILATGGGVVLRPANRELLRRAGRPVVWLQAAPGVVRGRLAADPTTASRRPGLTGGDPLAEVETAIRDREPLYRESADVIVDASAPADVVAERILALLPELDPTGRERAP
jgi:shikimate kinase